MKTIAIKFSKLLKFAETKIFVVYPATSVMNLEKDLGVTDNIKWIISLEDKWTNKKQKKNKEADLWVLV